MIIYVDRIQNASICCVRILMCVAFFLFSFHSERFDTSIDAKLKRSLGGVNSEFSLVRQYAVLSTSSSVAQN